MFHQARPKPVRLWTAASWLNWVQRPRAACGQCVCVCAGPLNHRRFPRKMSTAPAAAAVPVECDAAGETKAAPKKRGRPSKAAVPRIDFDMQIEEANAVSDMSRKMLKAARNLRKATQRSKTWLIRKAGKLRLEDLERIAVIKRFLKEGSDPEAPATVAASSSAALSAESVQDMVAAKKMFHQQLIKKTGSQGTMEAVLASASPASDKNTGKRSASSGPVRLQQCGKDLPRATWLQRGLLKSGLHTESLDGENGVADNVGDTQQHETGEDGMSVPED